MHTAHCARHITLCLKCNEPIPKRDFQEHQCSGPPEDSPVQPQPQPKPTPEKTSLTKKADAGRRVSFSNSTCPAIASAASVPTTTDTASVPEPICQYCHLEFPNKNMSEHENYCGSRTEQWYVAHCLKQFFNILQIVYSWYEREGNENHAKFCTFKALGWARTSYHD